MRKADADYLDDGPQKPVRIWSRTGRRPVLAAGNSSAGSAAPSGRSLLLRCAAPAGRLGGRVASSPQPGSRSSPVIPAVKDPLAVRRQLPYG